MSATWTLDERDLVACVIAWVVRSVVLGQESNPGGAGALMSRQKHGMTRRSAYW
jgi:hypothetical protein